MEDPAPEDIDPVIVELFRVNAPIREFMVLYLAKQITYQECLEHSLIKLSEQYSGAMLGWKDQVEKTKVEVIPPEKPKTLKLTGRMIEIAQDQEALPDQLAEVPLVNEKPVGTNFMFSDVERRKEKLPVPHGACPTCGFNAKLVIANKKVCAVCDARRGKAEFRHRSDNIIKIAQELWEFCRRNGIRPPELLDEARQLPSEEQIMLRDQMNRLT